VIPNAGRSSVFSNDELRQKFVDFTVPQATFLGADRSRPVTCGGMKRLNGMISGRSIGASFNRVLKGNGPCNAERLAARPERP